MVVRRRPAGVGAGDSVALMCRTRYEWCVPDFAIWAAGGQTVPVWSCRYGGERGLRGRGAQPPIAFTPVRARPMMSFWIWLVPS